MLRLDIEAKREDIRREIEKNGAELVDLNLRRLGGRSTLTLLVDKSGGISLDECSAINRRLSLLLDEWDVGIDSLEVNSPGLDRPLKTEKDFLKVVGDYAKIVYKNTDAKVLTHVGKVLSVKDGAVELGISGELPTLLLPLDSIIKAAREVLFGRNK